MDSNLIYVKTTSGENVIQERTRIIQRNVRMVLVLVDGHSSVADLIRKTGNLQLTENALVELEKAGFIELKDNSLLLESQRIAQEIRSSVTARAAHSLPATENREKHGFDGSGNAPIPLPPILDVKDEVEYLASRFSELPPDLDKFQRGVFADDRRRQIEGKENSIVARLAFLQRLKSMRIGANRAPDGGSKKLKPLRQHRTIKGTSWIFRIFSALMLVFILTGAALLLFPFGIFAPEIEKAFSSAVGRPVGIQEVHVKVYPEPGLVLGGVQIGQDNDVIRIREISLQPDLISLLSEQRGFRKVTADGMELQIERIIGMPTIFDSLSDLNKSPKIGAILFRDTDILFNGIVLKDTEAEIQRDAGGKMQALTIRSADKRLTLEVKPVAAAVDLAVEAFVWDFGGVSKFIADSLNFKGRLENGTLSISDLDIRIFDGSIKGETVVRVNGAKPNLSGNVVFERVNADLLGNALGIGGRLSGSLAGNMRFSASSETWPAIFPSIAGEGEFNIQRGSIYGVDLAEVARRVSETPIQGGITNFEQMSGRFRLAQGRNQFYDLNLASGLMRSTGQITVTEGERLSGRLELRMRGSVNQTRTQMSVTGTLTAPALLVAGF